MAKTKTELSQLADEILAEARGKGVQKNYFFTTTFNRYQMQLRILESLEKAIDEHGTTVTKEYVKGRENLVVNPAIVEYNKTSTAANNTAKTLMDIIKGLPEEEGQSLEQMMEELVE